MSGMGLPLAVMITIPAPWAHDRYMRQEIKDFYRYYATMMEPWDGPASILFTDGEILGAVLDRNGLRSSGYYITDDNQLILACRECGGKSARSPHGKEDRCCGFRSVRTCGGGSAQQTRA